MKQKFLLIIAFGLCYFITIAQNPPKREFRAAWLATYANIDWPSSGATTAQEQSTFIQRVDEHKTTGMNALFVQIRSQCDAMYPSPYEPWSADLTGIQGTAPSPYYDPLDFMITETRKKGMEFHAWINPYRALANASAANLAALSPNHIINTQPSWIMSAGTQRILNPGIPAVWDYVIKIVMDVVRRYDVDGIHFDDYFYPYPSAGTYVDDNEYTLYGRGIATKAEWRRSNVDSLIKRLGDSIRVVKPWVKFGISPSGIWLSQTGVVPNDPNGSNTSSGATQHYKDLYANSRLWLQQGWIDYLTPQIYWYIGQSGSDYNILIPWWNNNAFGRHIYSGMAGYKVGDVAQNAAFATDNTQIPQQIRLNRNNANIKGHVIYNTTSLRNNKLGFRDSLQNNYFNKPALQPTMSWKDNTPPAAATSLNSMYVGATSVNLTWTKPAAATNELDKAKRYTIYRSLTTPVDITNANNIIAITWNDTAAYTDNTVLPSILYYYVVTALDRFQNESVVSNTSSVFTVLPLQLLQFNARLATTKQVQLNWITTNEVNVDYFEVERSYANNVFETVKKVMATNNAGNNNYNTADFLTTNNNIIFYRIKIVDKDKGFKYSSTVKVIINKQENTLQLLNNIIKPGNNLTLLLNNTTDNLQYNILDVQGRVLQTGEIALINGIANIVLKSKRSVGIYYLQVFDKGVVHTAKFFVE